MVGLKNNVKTALLLIADGWGHTAETYHNVAAPESPISDGIWKAWQPLGYCSSYNRLNGYTYPRSNDQHSFVRRHQKSGLGSKPWGVLSLKVRDQALIW